MFSNNMVANVPCINEAIKVLSLLCPRDFFHFFVSTYLFIYKVLQALLNALAGAVIVTINE